MTKPLDVLVGRFIHHCGALELLTNSAIVLFSTDRLLASSMTEAPFARRIALLRRLLKERADLDDRDLKWLCDELDEIRQNRNRVAHNPISSREPRKDAPESILVVRFRPDNSSPVSEISRDEVADLVNRSRALLGRFVEMLPEVTKVDTSEPSGNRQPE